MANSLYITTTEEKSGKSLASLATMELLLKNIDRVGFFRPVISKKNNNGQDKHIELILEYFKVPATHDETFGMYEDEANLLLSQGKMNVLIEKILEKYKALEERFPFILIEGTDFTENTRAFETKLNAELAKNFGSPLLIVGMAHHKSTQEVVSNMKLAVETYQAAGCKVMGCFINRCNKDFLEEMETSFKREFKNIVEFISINPEDPVLISPTILEIKDFLNAEVLYTNNKWDSQVFRYSVAALGKLDAIIFTAGVGENASNIRKYSCIDLDNLGISIDLEKNKGHHEGIREIQATHSKVKILVVPTNEELEIAQETIEALKK